MQPERLGKEPASDAGPTAPETGGRPAPTRRLKWLATAGLAALIALTSLAVARVNVWFVPPYLILMGWILLGPRAAGPRSLAEAEAEFQEAQSIPPQPPPPTPTPPPIPTPPEPDPTPEPEPEPPPRRRLFGRSRRVDPARADAVPEPSSDVSPAPSGEPRPKASAVRGWFSRKSQASSLDDPEAEESDSGPEAGAEAEPPPSGSTSPSDEPATTTKTRRRRKKKVEAPPEPPTEVAWVRIGPNQFVRQETPLPTSEDPSPAAEPTNPELPPPTEPEPAADLDTPSSRLLAPTHGPSDPEPRDIDNQNVPSSEHLHRPEIQEDEEARTLSLEPTWASRPNPVDEDREPAAEVESPADPADHRPDDLSGPSTPEAVDEPAHSPATPLATQGAWDEESEEGDPPEEPSNPSTLPDISNQHDEETGDLSPDDPRLERQWDEERDEVEVDEDEDDEAQTDPRLGHRWDEVSEDEDEARNDPRLERQWDEEPDDAGPDDPRDDLADEPVGREDRGDENTSSAVADEDEEEEDWYDDEGDDEDRWGASAAELAESIVGEGRRDHEDEDARGHQIDDDRSGRPEPGDPGPAASSLPPGGGIVGYGQDLQSYLSDLINMAGGVGESRSPAHPPPTNLGDAPPPRDRSDSGPEIPTPREPEDRPADGDRSSPPDDDDDGAPAAGCIRTPPPIAVPTPVRGDPTSSGAIARRVEAGPDRPGGRIRTARSPGPWIKLPTLLDRSPDEPHPSRRPTSRPRPNPAPSRRARGPGPLERYLPRAPPVRPGKESTLDRTLGEATRRLTSTGTDTIDPPRLLRMPRPRPGAWGTPKGTIRRFPEIGRSDRFDVPSTPPAATRGTRRIANMN